VPSELHEKQNVLAARWARRQGFSVVATNVWAAGSRERVDVVGFRQGASLLIESKVSRADFAADARKPERQNGGIGLYRFYITPVGTVAVEDVPPGWGLLHSHGSKVIEVKRPPGNSWPGVGGADSHWEKFQHHPDCDAEFAMLFSIARRAVGGKVMLL
jgi:hypothetical protein